MIFKNQFFMATIRLHTFSFIILLFLLTACGGSSDGSSDNDGSNVLEPLTYTIGGSVEGLSGDGLILQNNGQDNLAVAGNTFEFSSTLENNSTYNVSVLSQPLSQTCSVTNGTGTIGEVNITNITITCHGWGISELITRTLIAKERSPQIATDPSGNALAIWSRIFTDKEVLANRYTAGSGWGDAEEVEPNNSSNATNPQISIDSNGDALAVWSQRDGSRDDIWANRYIAGSGWSNEEIIETENLGGANDPQIAIDSNGNAIAVWWQSDGVQFNIWANRYTFGSGWGTAVLVETNNDGNAMNPQIAIDQNGNAMTVWSQSNGIQQSIWSNRYTIGSGWGTAALIEDQDIGDAIAPQIAIDSNGNAIAVWSQTDNIWANRYIAGSGWSNEEIIETENLGNANDPQIAIDLDGNAMAVWWQSDGVQFNIWANRYAFGSGWGTSALVETNNDGDALKPQIAIDQNGNAMTVWSQSNGIQQSIWSNRYTIGSGWGNAALIEDQDMGGAFSPQIAIDSNGNAIAVWVLLEGAIDRIWANRYE